jgi:protein-L-isoaspartate O-methyltransferase
VQERIISRQEAFVKQLFPWARSKSLREAFLYIPRDRFISAFYEHFLNPDQQMLWRLIRRADIDREAWQQKIYQDNCLIIDIDEHGLPRSSSSQPSLMAEMLETLSVSGGQKVLEIGTGTGYNAALLAYIVGSPLSVTTIDIDRTFLPFAEQAIRDCVGGGMRLLTGDGRLGAPGQGLFHRIIATGSVGVIPPMWLKQLYIGGTFVANLRTTLANVMLHGKKQKKELVYAHVLPYQASLLALHDGTGIYQPPPVPLGPLPHKLAKLPTEGFFPAGLEDKEFGMFLYCHFPTLQKYRIWHGKSLFVYLADLRSHHLVQFYNGTVRGSSFLWRQVQHVAEEWLTLGKPMRQQYTFLFQDGRQSVVLGKLHWPLW